MNYIIIKNIIIYFNFKKNMIILHIHTRARARDYVKQTFF